MKYSKVIFSILLITITILAIKHQRDYISTFKYKIEYNCDFNTCRVEYTNKYKINHNCIEVNDNIYCGNYNIKEIK